MINEFDPGVFKNLFKPKEKSAGEDNGQITIIGGSHLFHGAPLFALSVASRIVDMVFFASPDPSVGEVASKIKSKLFSFIWIPIEEVEHYIEKSDAVLIGPGFLRFSSEKIPHDERYRECDEACQITKNLTQQFLTKFPSKKWVIDAGSLQTMEPEWIPEHAILTPNKKEYNHLFGDQNPQDVASKYKCILVLKGPETIVVSEEKTVIVKGGNPGLTKGGTGDTQAGLTVALLAKNDPFLAATCASYVIKSAADKLYEKVGVYYNADDLVDSIPHVLKNLVTN